MDTLIKQSQATAKNGLSVSKSGNAYGNSQSIQTGDADTTTVTINDPGHGHSVAGSKQTVSNANYYPLLSDGPTKNVDIVNASATGITASHSHTHYASFTPSVADNISVSMSDGDTETRPENYTIKIWKRIN